MTDREMALSLGQYINRLIEKVTLYEGVFLEYRVTDFDGRKVEIPWRADAKRIAQEQPFRDLADRQSSELRQVVGDDIPESGLIRALHHHYVGE
jgi:hypothetical protein